ncbi:MAG: imidazole glycerol phosphate synthase subunit HisH [Acidobacteriota bacterium]|nr:imidazole glycerol phosphate synthase subunit HisH [Acidobacteriota bacterium]
MNEVPTTTVTLVDYGVGNTASVIRAFRRLGADVDFTADLDRVAEARRLVLPGVAAFAPAMNRLLETGLESAVRAAVKRGGRLLGLCLGFQLLFEESEEHGIHRGLGLVPGRVRAFQGGVRTPHVGWNQLLARRSDGFTEGLPDGSYVYFVHSYRPEGTDAADVAAACDHGGEFPAIVQRGNVWGCQFHPEKSSENGRLLLSNFLKHGAT